ncbi:Metalloproteinase inhibitor 2, partial [Phalacrocorax carbo]
CCVQISRCLSIPCFVASLDECLWTDWAMEKNNVDGRQAKHYACIKRSDGSCAWYRGMAPPKQEFLD